MSAVDNNSISDAREFHCSTESVEACKETLGSVYNFKTKFIAKSSNFSKPLNAGRCPLFKHAKPELKIVNSKYLECSMNDFDEFLRNNQASRQSQSAINGICGRDKKSEDNNSITTKNPLNLKDEVIRRSASNLTALREEMDKYRPCLDRLLNIKVGEVVQLDSKTVSKLVFHNDCEVSNRLHTKIPKSILSVSSYEVNERLKSTATKQPRTASPKKSVSFSPNCIIFTFDPPH